MSPISTCSRLGFFSIGLCLMLSGMGCSTLSISDALPMLGGDRTELSESPEQRATCTVEMRLSAGRTKSVEVPLTAESRVQDVLDASQATKKFRNLEVFIMRRTNHASQPVLRMDCNFDRKKRQISWESDYAVIHGDRIIVREDRSDPFQKIVTSVLGPVLGGN